MHLSASRMRVEARRLCLLLALLLVALAPPLIAGLLLLGPAAMTLLLFGSLVGLMNTAAAGRRVGATAALLFILLAPVSVVVGQSPLAGTCLMAIACIFVGLSAAWPRYGSFTIVLIGMAFLMTLPTSVTDRLDGTSSEAWYPFAVLLGAAVCAYWPVVVLPLLHQIHELPRDRRNSRPDTLHYMVTMTILVSAATCYAMTLGRQTNGVWLPLTLLIVMRVGRDATKHLSYQRVIGTCIGGLVAVGIASVTSSPWLLGMVLFLALLGILATMGREPYSRYAFFLTIFVLLSTSLGQPALQAGIERIAYTVCGVVAVLVTSLLDQRLTKSFAGRAGRRQVSATPPAGSAPG